MDVWIPATGTGDQVTVNTLGFESVSERGDDLGMGDLSSTLGRTDGAAGQQADGEFFELCCQGRIGMST